MLWNRKYLLRLRLRLWKSFCSDSIYGSGSRQYLAVFQKQNKIAQNLALSMSDAAYFPKSWPFNFDFFTFYYILSWIRIHIRVQEPDPEP